MQTPTYLYSYAYNIWAFGPRGGTGYLAEYSPGLEAPPMPPTTITNVSLVAFVVSEERRMDISIEWSPPQYTNGHLTEYEIWIGRIELDPTDSVEVSGVNYIYSDTTPVSCCQYKY